MSRSKKKHLIYETSVMPPMAVTLYRGLDELREGFAERGADAEAAIAKLVRDVGAQTWVERLEGFSVSVVLIEDEDAPLHQRLALLAHEATHVATRWCEAIGEEDPGEEEFAYAVQAACGVLFDEYLAKEGQK